MLVIRPLQSDDLEDLYAILISLAVYNVDGPVEDLLRHAFLAFFKEAIDEPRYQHVGELGIGNDLSFDGFSSTGHWLFDNLGSTH